MEIFKIVIKEFVWLGFVLVLTIGILFPMIVVLRIADIQVYPQSADEPFSPMLLFISLFAQNLSLIICAFWRRKFEKQRLEAWNIQANQQAFLKKLLIGIIAGFVILAAVYCQEFILTFFFDEAVLTESAWNQVRSYSLNEKIVVLLVGAIFSPVVEELYFREAMFGSIYRQGFPAFAMFFSCAVFGIIHLNFLHIFAYFIYGIGFALVYLKTKSLISSITAHILINSILLSILLFW
jgi:membrane protease YdiL (CAAX protease family)